MNELIASLNDRLRLEGAHRVFAFMAFALGGVEPQKRGWSLSKSQAALSLVESLGRSGLAPFQIDLDTERIESIPLANCIQLRLGAIVSQPILAKARGRLNSVTFGKGVEDFFRIGRLGRLGNRFRGCHKKNEFSYD
jgi:hypothetical protein